MSGQSVATHGTGRPSKPSALLQGEPQMHRFWSNGNLQQQQRPVHPLFPLAQMTYQTSSPMQWNKMTKPERSTNKGFISAQL